MARSLTLGTAIPFQLNCCRYQSEYGCRSIVNSSSLFSPGSLVHLNFKALKTFEDRELFPERKSKMFCQSSGSYIIMRPRSQGVSSP